MIKIPWINHKQCNWDVIASNLKQSFTLNQLTNYGPVVRKLELYFTEQMNLSPDKRVIVVTNAALGLNALVSGINLYKNKKFKYATQAYTFPCAAQGALEDSVIVDLDNSLGLDLTQVPDNIDGIIVTNLFGNICDINKYVKWANINNKILLFDNATVPFTKYNYNNVVNYGVGCIISLHHTKPIGFGEGGLVIVDKEYESSVRKCINFGFEVVDGKVLWHRYGSNCKMSEISASVILSYLHENKELIYKHHIEMYKYFNEKIKNISDVKLFPNYSSDTPFVSCFAILFNREITNDHIYQFELNNITAKKYYTPLADLPHSTKLFKNILCLPCHLEVNKDTIDRYILLIKTLL